MVTPSTSWNTVRVYGTWHNMDGSLRAGSYKVTIPMRVTNTTDDVIIPSGVFSTGTLNVTPGAPSLDIQVPCNDDPDNSPNGWQPRIEVTLSNAEGEIYDIDTHIGVPVNLRTIVLAGTIPVPVDVLIRGVPGGLAELDVDGDVIDASGAKVIAGGGGTTTVDGLTDATVVGKAVVKATDKAAARTAIDAADVNATATALAAKADAAAMTTALAAKADAAATSTALSGKADATATTTALATKAPTASPTFTGTVSGVTKAHVGLNLVDNTPDTSKPVSTAQAASIALRMPWTAGLRPRIPADSSTTVPVRATWIAANAPGYVGSVDWDLLAYLDHPGNTPGAQAAAQYQPLDGVFGRTSS